jgi:hypothetical protein
MGDLTGANAADKAAQAQISAANAAAAVQLKEFNTIQDETKPYRDAGVAALGNLQGKLPDLTRSFTMNDFHEDPGYQFQLQQGQQALQRSAAARGLLNSGATLQSMDSYTQGIANQGYENAYNRFTQNQQKTYNMLSNLAGIGQTGTNTSATAGANYANAYGNSMSAIGNANSAAAMQPYNGMMGLAGMGASLLPMLAAA